MTEANFPRWIVRLMQGFLVIGLPALFVVFNARLVMFPVFMQIEYQRVGFPEDSYGFTVEDRLQYGTVALDYVLGGEELDDKRLPAELCYPPDAERDCQMFNPSELHHLEDVRVVAQALFAAAILIGIAALVIGWTLTRYVSFQALRSALMQSSLLTLGLIVAIILVALTAWDTFFTLFHSLFFEEGTWRFFYSDTLIRLYPEQFWFDAALVIGVLTTLYALIILAWGWRSRLYE